MIDTKVWKNNQGYLEQLIIDLHWMARRYVDGRQSYAVGLFNDYVDNLRRLGFELNPTADNEIYAEDAMFGKHKSPLDRELIDHDKASDFYERTHKPTSSNT